MDISSGQDQPLLNDASQTEQRGKIQKRLVYIFLAFFLFSVILVCSLAAIRDKPPNPLLIDHIDVDEIMDILTDLNDIANKNNGSRSVSKGYNASATYILNQLAANTDLTFYKDSFIVPISSEYQQPSLQRIESTTTVTYCYGLDFYSMDYSANGSFVADFAYPTANLTGCNPTDYANFPPGSIAVVLRGICTFYQKAVTAAAVGASAILIYNQATADPQLFSARCGGDNSTQLCPLPAISSTYKVGNDIVQLLNVPSTVQGDFRVYRITEVVTTYNIIADSKTGNPDHTVVIGSHLDSVPAGPGINDNGSGSATNLHLAILFKRLGINPRNRVRFAWWSAEEIGLLGSNHYVDNLKQNDPKSLGEIAANLNYDMIGSPNAIYGVYNGSSDVSVPGSAVIQRIYADYFDEEEQAYTLVPFDGRSDYAAFMNEGIPAGGLFTGAEVKKTLDLKKIYGGVANVAYDPCYHLACDNITNIDTDTLEEMVFAASHAFQTLFDQEDLHAYLWPKSSLEEKEYAKAEMVTRQPFKREFASHHGARIVAV